MKKIFTLIAVILLNIIAYGQVEVTEFLLNKETIELTVGDSETLIATIYPENASEQFVTWHTNNPDIATVDAEGNITTLSPGTVIITALLNNDSWIASCSITVLEKIATSIVLNKSELELAKGTSENLIATISPENTSDKGVYWESSDYDIVSVFDGKVTAVNYGTATITAKSSSNQELTAECVVTVPEQLTEIYLNNGGESLWKGYDAKYAICYYINDEEHWSDLMTLAENETEIYVTKIPSYAERFAIARLQSDATEGSYEKTVEQAASLVFIEGKDMYTFDWGWSKYGEKTKTGFEDLFLQKNDDVQKFMINGEIYIIKNGQVYNFLGVKQIVELDQIINY